MYSSLRSLWLIAATLMLSGPVLAGSADQDNMYDDGIRLTITTKPFEPGKHRVKKCGGAVCFIDGIPAYGTYGLIPKNEVVSLILERNGKTVSLDVKGMYNPNVNNSNIKKYVKITKQEANVYDVRGYFSHDDGDDDMYICRWLVVGEESYRSYFGDYEALAILSRNVQKDFGIE